MMRVVISCTTLPDRYWKLKKMVGTLLDQTHKVDAIYIGLPKIMKRGNIVYGPLPDEILKHVTVVNCEDYGPITKLLGGLVMEQDPNTVIITVDDDKMYSPMMVESLISLHKKHPTAAIGSSGMFLRYPCPMCAIHPNEKSIIYRIPKFNIPINGRKVDSIYGYPGALYIRGFFPINEYIVKELLQYTVIDNSLFMNDDIVISGYLSTKGIERRIFKGLPTVESVTDENGNNIRHENEISYNLDTFFNRMNKACSVAKENGMYQHMEYYDVCTESIYSSVGIIIFCILVIIIAIYFIILFK